MTARIAAIGLTSWDQIIVTDHYPEAGSYAIVRKTLEQSGGTTANTAHALSLLGVPVTLAAIVGDDEQGVRLRQDLAESGCDVRHVRVRTGEPSDTGIIVVSGLLGETDRTIFWQQGARLRMGDPLPINEFFEHDLVFLDVDDERLRRFIVDLPLHVSPRTRILGTLTYLPELPSRDALDVALRYNYLVGNERELRYVTRTDATDQALTSLRARMPGADLRLAAISLGARGCVIMTLDETIHIPGYQVEVVDTTGAGDAFAAGIALGIVNNRPLEQIGQIGNALGALSIRALGARAGLPARDELIAFLGDDSAFLHAEP